MESEYPSSCCAKSFPMSWFRQYDIRLDELLKGYQRMGTKRRHSRIPLRLSTTVHTHDEGTIEGTTENASFSGLLVECTTSHTFSTGDTCIAELILNDKAELKVRFECTVIRIRESHIALQFTSYDDKDFEEHYRNLMLLNSPDPETMLKELNENGRSPG